MNEYLSLFETKKMVLIMSLPQNDPDLCRAAFDAGADAVKVHINVDHRASGTHFGTLREERDALETMLSHRAGPMGLVPGGSPQAVMGDLREALSLPFSFYSVYAHHMPWTRMPEDKVLMAACDSTYSLAEISGMPRYCGVLEASVIPGAEYGAPLTIRDLIKYRQITETVSVPVIVPTQRAIRPCETQVLAEAGVRAVMIGAIVTGKTRQEIISAIKAFRKAIDEGEVTCGSR